MARLLHPEPRLLAPGWPFRAKLRITDILPSDTSSYFYEFTDGVSGPFIYDNDLGEFGILKGTVFPGEDTASVSLFSITDLGGGNYENMVVDSLSVELANHGHCIPAGLNRKLRYYVGEGISRCRVEILTWAEGLGLVRKAIASLDLNVQEGEVIADVLPICASYLQALQRNYMPLEGKVRLDDTSAQPFTFRILELTDSSTVIDTVVEFPALWVVDADNLLPNTQNLELFAPGYGDKLPVDTKTVVRHVNVTGQPALSTHVTALSGTFSNRYNTPPILAENIILRETITASAIGPMGILLAGSYSSSIPKVYESIDGGRTFKKVADFANSIAIGIRQVYVSALWYHNQIIYGLVGSGDMYAPNVFFRVFRLSGNNVPVIVYDDAFRLCTSATGSNGQVVAIVKRASDDVLGLLSSSSNFSTNVNTYFNEILSLSQYYTLANLDGEAVWIAGSLDYLLYSSNSGQTWDARPASGLGAFLGIPPVDLVQVSFIGNTSQIMVVALDSTGYKRVIVSGDNGFTWSEKVAIATGVNTVNFIRLHAQTADEATIFGAQGRLDRVYQEANQFIASLYFGLDVKTISKKGTMLVIAGAYVGNRNGWPLDCRSTTYVSYDDGRTFAPFGHFGVIEVVPKMIMNLVYPDLYKGFSSFTTNLVLDSGEETTLAFESEWGNFVILGQDDCVLYFRSSNGGMESLRLLALTGKIESDISKAIVETPLLESGPIRVYNYQERSTGWMTKQLAIRYAHQLANTRQTFIGDTIGIRKVALDIKKLAFESRPGLTSLTIRWRES